MNRITKTLIGVGLVLATTIASAALPKPTIHTSALKVGTNTVVVNDIGQTYNQVYVNTYTPNSKNIINKWVTRSQMSCKSKKCTIKIPTISKAGTAKIWVKNYKSGSYSSWGYKSVKILPKSSRSYFYPRSYVKSGQVLRTLTQRVAFTDIKDSRVTYYDLKVVDSYGRSIRTARAASWLYCGSRGSKKYSGYCAYPLTLAKGNNRVAVKPQGGSWSAPVNVIFQLNPPKKKISDVLKPGSGTWRSGSNAGMHSGRGAQRFRKAKSNNLCANTHNLVITKNMKMYDCINVTGHVYLRSGLLNLNGHTLYVPNNKGAIWQDKGHLVNGVVKTTGVYGENDASMIYVRSNISTAESLGASYWYTTSWLNRALANQCKRANPGNMNSKSVRYNYAVCYAKGIRKLTEKRDGKRWIYNVNFDNKIGGNVKGIYVGNYNKNLQVRYNSVATGHINLYVDRDAHWNSIWYNYFTTNGTRNGHTRGNVAIDSAMENNFISNFTDRAAGRYAYTFYKNFGEKNHVRTNGANANKLTNDIINVWAANNGQGVVGYVLGLRPHGHRYAGTYSWISSKGLSWDKGEEVMGNYIKNAKVTFVNPMHPSYSYAVLDTQSMSTPNNRWAVLDNKIYFNSRSNKRVRYTRQRRNEW